MWPMLSKLDSSVHMVKTEFLVCYLSMHSPILPSEVMTIWHLGYGKYEIEKLGVKSLGFIIGSIANWAKNLKKVVPLGFKFWSKTFAGHLKHTQDYNFAKISKAQNHSHRYFQP